MPTIPAAALRQTLKLLVLLSVLAFLITPSFFYITGSSPSFALFGCDEVSNIPSFQGFTPAYPIMLCLRHSQNYIMPWAFRSTGCRLAGYSSIIVLKDGSYKPLLNQAAFQAVFAPIDSADEALSYAHAVTPLQEEYIRYRRARDDPSIIISEYLHSSVKEIPEGYQVHLYDLGSGACSCYDVTAAEVTVLISHQGEVREVERLPHDKLSICRD